MRNRLYYHFFYFAFLLIYNIGFAQDDICYDKLID